MRSRFTHKTQPEARTLSSAGYTGFRWIGILLVGIAWGGCRPEGDPSAERASRPDTLRIVTYNIEDVRTADLKHPSHPRLTQAAALLQRLRPDIVLLNEFTYDQPGDPGYEEGDPVGQNGQRFVDTFLAKSQGEGLEPLRYQAYMAPVNTGLASGLDLNNDGRTVTTVPDVPPSLPSGAPGPQTAEGRAYGNDAWGFGTFPGQYGMVMLVRDGLDITADSVRTFRLLTWSSMPEAKRPIDPDTGESWYSDEEWEQFRLSSKSHWDVPVRLPNGAVLHVLASHPTPPAFDGDEQRNVKRNHDEIRFWADYLDGAAYVEDDSGRAGGLPLEASFVILGDQNADPDEGSSLDDPIGRWLLGHPRINGEVAPRAAEQAVAAYPDLDPDDTARWGLRVDYVLPSVDLHMLDSGVWRPVGADTVGIPISDHFPVWMDVVIAPAE